VSSAGEKYVANTIALLRSLPSRRLSAAHFDSLVGLAWARKPSQDGVGFSDAGDLSERSASQGASRSRPGRRARDHSTAISRAASPSEYGSPWPSWFTVPLTYASSRTDILFLMPTAYLTVATGGLVF
jgi:hypothetical protein